MIEYKILDSYKKNLSDKMNDAARDGFLVTHMTTVQIEYVGMVTTVIMERES
jgi:hypothetical protein